MNVSPTDWSTLQTTGRHVVIGSAFAFLSESAFETPALAWVRRLLPKPGPQVISLLSPDAVELPGARVGPNRLPELKLAGIVSDKALYREGRETVNLFVVNALAPDRDLILDVTANGQEWSRLPVRLDARGAAAIALRDLPGGEYAVRFRGSDAPACTFTVAEYKLAPLVASMEHRTLQGEALAMTLRVESFGAPIEGAVTLELTDRGSRIATAKGKAKAGLVEVTFKLKGEGPHAVNVQLVDDPSKTATVPIAGSRASERSQTTFSRLGTWFTGSLLPSEDARCVRGIWLQEGSAGISPLQLDRIDTRTASLKANLALPALRIVVIDPTFPASRPGRTDPHPGTKDRQYAKAEAEFNAGNFAGALASFESARQALEGPHPNYAYFIACCWAKLGDRVKAVAWLRAALEDGWSDLKHLAGDTDLASLRGYEPYESLCTAGYREYGFEAVPAGKTIDIEMAGPLSILAFGTFLDGAPFEGWAAVIAPDGAVPVIHVPKAPEPGAEVAIDVETGSDAAVWIVVKDARLLTGDTPASLLAGRLKAMVEGTEKLLRHGPVVQKLSDLAQPIPPPGYALAGSGTRMYQPVPAMSMPMSRPMPKMAPPPDDDGDLMEDESGPGAMKVAETSADEPEVLFAGLVAAEKGRASVTVRLAPSFADYVVEAFVLSGIDWASTQARFRAEKSPFVALDLPAYVHPDDAAVGRVTVGAGDGAKVRVTRDGREVELHGAMQSPRATLTFVAEAGDYVAVVEEGGRRDVAEKRVDVPGKLRHVTKALQLVEPGRKILRTPDMIGLRILPGLEKPFSALLEATADYGHACCEQTAAKMMAACAMYALAANEKMRAKADAIIVAGVKREETMWLRGRGFKMYPESENTPHDYYGPKASRYLHYLALLRELKPGRTLSEAIDRGLAMAADGCKAYKIAWPPKDAASCEEAYTAVRFGDEKAREKAMVLIRDRAGQKMPEAPASPWMGGAVGLRTEAAYAAAAMLRTGDRARALALANEVTKAFGPEGRLYSTVDSVAAIALMSELRAAGIVGGAGKIEIDGRAVDAGKAVGEEARASVVGIAGVVPVEIVRIVEEDWAKFAAGVPIVVSLEKKGKPARTFAAGDAIELRVKLQKAYKTGDLVWVCLPDALSRVVGGGQVKRFSLDFAGKDEVVASLAATGVTIGRDGKAAPQHFAVCVRNMFEEERAGNPGPLEVTVKGADAPGLLTRLFRRP